MTARALAVVVLGALVSARWLILHANLFNDDDDASDEITRVRERSRQILKEHHDGDERKVWMSLDLALVTTKGYPKALADRVREYDARGRLPAFFLVQTQFFYEGSRSRLYLSPLEDPLGPTPWRATAPSSS